ncbi:pyridoxamine 5'-phosphate oxidase family protein [Streptococcus iniae]|uniref:ABC transporter ATP-binding protein n=1 Tax=Streptococcus iniae TaxID=1346 RepID=A0A3L8GQK8_STRIN|nr:pyridoxamine 5'-phosphate oxidase family protein [Streptococcus iniae]AGM97928.1 pyridoxamine 5'-phosphate oxidase protein [Streptococcus iniae SF1]AHY15013.1 ABC transporter ATP-binding protein [Streptococcus iniae]AHY16884.1 ABC transporter ATP-binding protein [Streptococcus iniae]AJG25170.1 ABC transporter ATP-binding protein [Streptococcus iniae]APD31075.1 ABC transporter ATP-binding protein [Streptococcus iniae]
MKLNDMMTLLEDMKVGVFATIDSDGNPHARHAHITAANEEGIFFMTSKETHFYKQLMSDERIALTTMMEDGYLIQVMRIEGLARPVENDYLKEVFVNNSYYDFIYKDLEGDHMQIFQIYDGEGFYHSLTQGHKYVFSVGKCKTPFVKVV